MTDEKKEHHHESKPHEQTHHKHTVRKKNNPAAIWQAISAVLLVALIATIFWNNGENNSGLNQEAAKEKALTFINSNLLPPGTSATISSIEESNGLYKLKLDVSGNEFDSYMTKDASLLFPNSVDLTKKPEVPVPDEQQEAPADYSSLEKVEKPKMTVWIESRCPFGIQAANGMYFVNELLGDSVDLELRYMVSKSGDSVQAMHGPEELLEDKREICVREEQPDKFWDYMKCYVETGKTTDCEDAAGVDSDKLSECVEERSVGLLIEDAEDWANIYRPAGGKGSPSFFLNDVKINEYSFSQNGRSPENLKQILCNSMENPTDDCETLLAANNPPRGFGSIDTGTAADVAQANC